MDTEEIRTADDVQTELARIVAIAQQHNTLGALAELLTGALPGGGARPVRIAMALVASQLWVQALAERELDPPAPYMQRDRWRAAGRRLFEILEHVQHDDYQCLRMVTADLEELGTTMQALAGKAIPAPRPAAQGLDVLDGVTDATTVAVNQVKQAIRMNETDGIGRVTAMFLIQQLGLDTLRQVSTLLPWMPDADAPATPNSRLLQTLWRDLCTTLTTVGMDRWAYEESQLTEFVQTLNALRRRLLGLERGPLGAATSPAAEE